MYAGYHLGRPLDGKMTDFAYWKGPLPPAISASASEAEARHLQDFTLEFQNALARSFTSSNMVKSVLLREIGSSLAKMNWTLMQPGAVRVQEGDRTDLEQEAEALAAFWWRSARNHPERAIRLATLAARREGRGALRFRVAAGLLRKGADGAYRVRPDLDMAGIARFIRLENIAAPEQCRVWENADDFSRHALYSYTDALGKDAAEVCTVTDDGKTTLRVLKSEDGESSNVTLDLGGRITFIELSIEPLITEQVLQNQMAYNTASTMILRNTELAGFIERYGVNLEPPFEQTPDPNNPGQFVRKYLPVKTGAGSINLWRQATYDKTDAQGNYLGEEALGRNSQYGRFEPVSPDSLTTAAAHNKANLYDEVGQTYALMGSDATASGRSREVAIADFNTIRQEVIDLGTNVISEVQETFLALVSALANLPGHFADIQVQGQVRSQIVPPSAADRKANLDDAEAGVISAQTARQRQGIDEGAQEDAQIEREIQAGTSPTVLSKPAPAPAPAPVPAGGA